MNIFLVIIQKNNKESLDINLDLVRSYLPVSHDSEQRWSNPGRIAQMYSFEYWPGQIRSSSYIHMLDDSAFTFDGFPDLPEIPVESDLPSQILKLADKNGPHFIKNISGEFSAGYIKDNSAYFTSNVGGTHPLFFTENDQLIAISNWMGILFGLPGVDDSFDFTGLSWICYERSIQDCLTPFEKIRMIPPGSFVVISSDKGMTIEHQKYEDLLVPEISEAYERNPVEAFGACQSFMTSYIHKACRFYNDAPVWIQLSGGKDSRIVIALLKSAGLLEKIDRVETRGNLYSPEVLSAKGICEMLGGLPHHIDRPKFMNPDAAMQANKITGQILAFQGCFSLYDMGGVGPMTHPHIDFVGHHSVLKNPASFKKCRTATLPEFVGDVLASRPLDPLRLLNKEVHDRFADWYHSTFESYMAEGASLSDSGLLYLLRQRSLWLIMQANRSSVSRPHHNPLMHSDLIRFMFSVPHHVKDTELFHFYMTRLCAPELLNMPFANDTWSDTIKPYLSDGSNVPVSVPYRDQKVYRLLKPADIRNNSVGLLEDITPFLINLFQKHKKICSNFIDIESAGNMLLRPKHLFLQKEIKSALGFATVLILLEYGKALLQPSNREAISSDICDRIKANDTALNVIPDLQSIDEKIENHERCIAEITEYNHGRFQNQYKVRMFFNSPDRVIGSFDFMHQKGYSAVAKGWALSLDGSRPAVEVVIANSRQMVLASARVGEPREDVAAKFENDRLRMCGWSVTFELAPDQCEFDREFYAFLLVPETQNAYALKNWFRFNQGNLEKQKTSPKRLSREFFPNNINGVT